jgi:hypothetical protein
VARIQREEREEARDITQALNYEKGMILSRPSKTFMMTRAFLRRKYGAWDGGVIDTTYINYLCKK